MTINELKDAIQRGQELIPLFKNENATSISLTYYHIALEFRNKETGEYALYKRMKGEQHDFMDESGHQE